MDYENAIVSWDAGYKAKEDLNILARFIIGIDPISNIKYADIYSDDGNGFGSWIVRITIP